MTLDFATDQNNYTEAYSVSLAVYLLEAVIKKLLG